MHRSLHVTASDDDHDDSRSCSSYSSTTYHDDDDANAEHVEGRQENVATDSLAAPIDMQETNNSTTTTHDHVVTDNGTEKDTNQVIHSQIQSLVRCVLPFQKESQPRDLPLLAGSLSLSPNAAQTQQPPPAGRLVAQQRTSNNNNNNDRRNSIVNTANTTTTTTRAIPHDFYHASTLHAIVRHVQYTHYHQF
jgi:hypothetical protein